MPSGIFTLKQQELALGQGAWTNQPPVSLNYLVVAGGGGGASGVSGSNQGAGGGAGGLLQGSIPITSGTSYTVTVGGAGSAGSNSDGGSGSNSVFSSITAIGGGGGGRTGAGLSGGSGGGGGGTSGIGGQGTFGQGNRGSNAASSGAGGAGGGAGTVAPSSNGGAGIASDISGIRTAYAGGGGGGNGGSPAFSGGAGGGGNGGISFGVASSTAGGSNTGGGGGGGNSGETVGAAGGSGIVIISYPGTTQWFTGGTLSYANGNVIHTFYSSGTLAPTAASNYINTDYQIERSLRFNSADSAYLNRTPASAGNRKTFTWSFWMKRTAIDGSNTYPAIYSGGAAGNPRMTIDMNYTTSGDLSIGFNNTGSSWAFLSTAAVFRDFSAWYHIVIACDLTQPTDSNRVKVYVNNVQQTLTGTYPPNSDSPVNNTVAQNIGRYAPDTDSYLNAYLTEFNFIDGQALNPYSFGYYNPNTGVWSPLKYVGSYGTNGFYLNFSDNSNTTAATLGKDYSGNGNNWTPNNFSVTAGAGNDSLVDTPTPYGTDTGAGGEVRGNYATLNPLNLKTGLSLANGNLAFSNSGNANRSPFSTAGMTSGKWYCEVKYSLINLNVIPGVVYDDGDLAAVSYIGNRANGYGYESSGLKYNNGSGTSYGASWTTSDTIGIALDLDNLTVTFYKNGTSQGTAFSSLPSGKTWFFGFDSYGSGAGGDVNFGQRPFAYTAPSGFKALCTQNLPTPTIGATSATRANKYFDVVLRNGGGSSGGTYSTTVNMSNGAWLWDRPRNQASSNYLIDSVRGISKFLVSNSTQAENTDATFFTNFGSSSFTTGSTDWGTTVTVVDWIWAANGSGSSNTAGSISSTVSANTTAGFSIVTYTGTGANATVGHGLGVAPKWVIVKQRNATRNWLVWNDYIFSLNNGNVLFLDTTDGAYVAANNFNSTAPTSTVFSVGTNPATNDSSATYVAYCFAPVAGYSAFGSYTGNGSTDGPFIYTGFRPEWVLRKRTDTAGASWRIIDSVRNTYNLADSVLEPNTSDATETNNGIDILSNGFKCRSTDTDGNANGGTYIYAAFAESPFKYALAR